MIRIGTASAVVSPPEGANLCGYPNGDKRKNTGVLLDLKAKALGIDDGNKKIIIITSDFIGLKGDLVKRIRDGISAKTGMPAEAILVSCSHTHSGPYLGEFGGVRVDQAYLDETMDAMIAIGVKAADASDPVTVGVGTGEVDLCHNRRVLDAEGKSSSGWEDHEHGHTGIIDKRVFTLVFKGQDGKVKAVIGNYACHPVVMGPPNFKVSADYPGYMQAYLEKVFPGAHAMFANAGGGNINPYKCIGDDDDEARKMGATLGKEIERIIASVETAEADAVSAEVYPVTMAPNPLMGGKMAQRVKDPEAPVNTEVQMMKIGKDILIVTAPGELLVEIAMRIKDASPVKNTLVFAYANDGIGYIPPPEIADQGGYEVTNAKTHGFEPTVLKLVEEKAAAL